MGQDKVGSETKEEKFTDSGSLLLSIKGVENSLCVWIMTLNVEFACHNGCAMANGR